MACVEDAHTMEKTGGNLPQGQVSGFRLSLWAEHLGTFEHTFKAPHTLQCARRVREMAEANWAAFAAEECQALPHGHLMKYPYRVDDEGWVTGEVECFPDLEDVKAYVVGTRPPIALELMTT